MPAQMHHWLKLSAVVPKIRFMKSSVVTRKMAAREMPYRLSCMAPGTASRSKIVLRWSRHRRAAARWKNDSVVSSSVAPRTAPPSRSPIWYAASAPTVITAPCTHSRTQSVRDSTGAPTGRGGRAITPFPARSKPRAIASGMSTTMFSQRIWSGLSGAPLAMPMMPAPRKTAM